MARAAYVMYVDIKPVEGENVRQQFAFFGETEHACEEESDALAGRCAWYDEKRKSGLTAASISKIDRDDWPEYDELGAQGLDDEEEDENEDEEDEEEQEAEP